MVFIALLVFPLYFTILVFAKLSEESRGLARGWLAAAFLFATIDMWVYKPAKVYFYNVFLPSLASPKLRGVDPLTRNDLFDGADVYLAVRHPDLPAARVLLAARLINVSSPPPEDIKLHSSSHFLGTWSLIVLLPEIVQEVIVLDIVALVVNLMIWALTTVFEVLGFVVVIIAVLAFAGGLALGRRQRQDPPPSTGKHVHEHVNALWSHCAQEAEEFDRLLRTAVNQTRRLSMGFANHLKNGAWRRGSAASTSSSDVVPASSSSSSSEATIQQPVVVPRLSLESLGGHDDDHDRKSLIE